MGMNAEQLLDELKHNPEMCGIYSAVCKKDFKSYTLTLFYLVNGSKYKLKPFHTKVMKALQDLVEGKNTKRNLALCLPVGAGKSILVEYFITWCFARSVDNTFVYTAYSDRLINKLSKETKDIIEHPAWKLLFRHYLKKDDRQKINYSFQGAKNRTGLTAGTMNSALTGLDAGHPSVEGFSGALICFPYEQKVWTDKGKLQIGDIVENKLDVKVFSMSVDDEVQLKPIEAYVKHEGDELVKVTLKDGNSFTCTQNHRVWTENRGYIEAKDLENSDSAWGLDDNNIVNSIPIENISFVGKCDNSYCLTVEKNHNLFVGESKGFLVKNCDDPSSADEIAFPNARETVIRTYDEKLATRRRTANTPTILIMQRLHVDDLVGWTKQTEPDQWEYVEIPALDENNNSFWEERYPAKDLMRIRDQNSYKFQAQYQQNPIIAGGQIIKSEWFQYYQSHPHYTKLFIASDTAMKTGQHNDYSVIMVWGMYEQSIYLIDMLRGKWEAPDLLKQVRMLTNKYYLWESRLRASAFYIEDKASGIGLIQQLKRESKIPVIPIVPTKDKVSRVEEILPTLQAGRVFLPFSKDYGQNPVIIGECESFARDLSHAHDDICLVAGTRVATLFGDKNIEDMEVGDLVITPFGIKKVLDAGQTGFTETVQNLGLEGTYNHKVFAGDKFENLCDLKYDGVVDTLSYGGLLRWKYKKLLNLMESNTDLWERKDIILANQTPMLAEKVLKDFMLRFGNIIADKKYQKATLFTTKMVTILTTISLTWSVYQLANIFKGIRQSLWNIIGQKNNENISKKLENSPRFGMQAKKVENGIETMQKPHSTKKGKQKSVQTVVENIKPVMMPCCVNVACEQGMLERTGCEKKKVYNIKVQDVGVYYANGILVSNCDTLVHSINASVGFGRTFSIFET